MRPFYLIPLLGQESPPAEIVSLRGSPSCEVVASLSTQVESPGNPKPSKMAAVPLGKTCAQCLAEDQYGKPIRLGTSHVGCVLSRFSKVTTAFPCELNSADNRSGRNDRMAGVQHENSQKIVRTGDGNW